MIISVNPTGKIIEGHVLDCAKKPLEEKLRQYDEFLYLQWNAKKLWGWGCWELRRRPEQHQIQQILHIGEMKIAILSKKEIGIVNHVCDVPFLNYSLLEKVKRMDTWQQSYKAKDWAHDYEYREAKYMEQMDEKRQSNLRYNLKQLKNEIRDFREYVLEGHSPADIAQYWGKLGS